MAQDQVVLLTLRMFTCHAHQQASMNFSLFGSHGDTWPYPGSTTHLVRHKGNSLSAILTAIIWQSDATVPGFEMLCLTMSVFSFDALAAISYDTCRMTGWLPGPQLPFIEKFHTSYSMPCVAAEARSRPDVSLLEATPASSHLLRRLLILGGLGLLVTGVWMKMGSPVSGLMQRRRSSSRRTPRAAV